MTALSHVVGAREPPLLDITIGEALGAAAARWPNQEALVSRHQGVRLTWREFLEQSDAFAAGLVHLGLRPGDRVGVWAPNCVEWAIAQFATARAGLIQVNINPAYRLSELEFTLTKVGVRALICASTFKSSNYVAMVEDLGPGVVTSMPGGLAASRLPDLDFLIKIDGAPRAGWFNFEDIAGLATEDDHSRLAVFAADLKSHDPINIQFTSGTTGMPKGATLSHHNVLNNGYFVGLGMGLREGDRLCVPVPLYHCFGMVMSNLACLVHGATMVYPSASFDAKAVLATVEAERCTALHGVPTMFIAELQDPDFGRYELSSLRTGLMAGAPCPMEVMRQVVDRMHLVDIGIAYGMTETSPVSFQTAITDPLSQRVSSIGTVQPHIEVKIVDPDGRTVPRGMAGELCTRGYSVMLGYWRDVERTQEAIDSDGWMHTGDLATIDDEGRGNIVGRIKDMIIRGGENIYPREIEDFLYRHPKISDVQIVGVPDTKYGEEVCAWIQLKPGETCEAADITEFCRGQIAHYKIPRYVRFVEAFPMTITGKIQKFEIRQIMTAELGLTEAATA